MENYGNQTQKNNQTTCKTYSKQAQTQKIHYSNIEKYYSNLTQPFYFNTFKKQN